MAKFDLTKFLTIVNAVAPIVLLTVPKGEKIGQFIPTITQAIVSAEQIKGATGAEKKAHVLEIVAAGVATANATGKVKLDGSEVAAVAGAGIDAVIGTVAVIQGAKVVKPVAQPTTGE